MLDPAAAIETMIDAQLKATCLPSSKIELVSRAAKEAAELIDFSRLARYRRDTAVICGPWDGLVKLIETLTGQCYSESGVWRSGDRVPDRGVGALLLGGLGRRVRLRWLAG
jgi:hypothetical protein